MTQTKSATWGDLARQFPNALARLEQTLAARKEREAVQAAAAPKRPALTCPHCGADAKVFTVAAFGFPVLRDDCCESRLYETAAAALSYSERVLADPDEQDQQNERYVELRARITSPTLLGRLDALEIKLEGAGERVIASGMCSGAYSPGPVANLTFAPIPGGDL